MNEEMMVTSERVNDTAVVSVRGEIDVASAPQLRTELHQHTDEGTGIVIDLRDVTFLDSSALGVLVGAHRRCSEQGIEFRLVINSARVLRIFEITGLNSVFTISSTIEEPQ